MKIIDDELTGLENRLLSVESELYRWEDERKAMLNQIAVLKRVREKELQERELQDLEEKNKKQAQG